MKRTFYINPGYNFYNNINSMGSGASAASASIDSAFESSVEAVENEFSLMFKEIKETVHSDLNFYNYPQHLRFYFLK